MKPAASWAAAMPAAVMLVGLATGAFAQPRPAAPARAGTAAPASARPAAPPGGRRMEIMLERLDGSTWRTIDPGLVLEQGDRVRFRFHTDFDGFLYVMNQSSSGKYEQLFPREETGQDNRISAGKEYHVPATASAFRIAGPAGYEIVYWLVTPALLTGAPSANRPPKPITLIPRCDDTMLRARGECIDNSAGPKLVPRGEELPANLAGAAGLAPRELIFMRQNDTAVISSPAAFAGPVIYEFRLAHK
jgi:putative hemolysin